MANGPAKKITPKTPPDATPADATPPDAAPAMRPMVRQPEKHDGGRGPRRGGQRIHL